MKASIDTFLRTRLHIMVFVLTGILGISFLAPRTLEASTATVTVVADNYLKKDNKNKNKGSDTVLKISEAALSHVLIRFDQAAIAAAIGTGTLVEARLKLYIEQNWGGWTTPGRRVEIHRMTSDWTEMGSTWNCANDTDPSNSVADCATQWAGGSYVAQETDHTNYFDGTIGWNNFNVTSDVAQFLSGSVTNYGWLIRKQDTSLSGDVDISSLQSTNSDHRPYLLLTINFGPPECYATPSPGPNQYGWNNSNVTVTCSCSDQDGCSTTGGGTVANSGADQVVLCHAADALGATSDCGATVDLDKTSPVIQISEPDDDATFTEREAFIRGDIIESLSGVKTITCNNEPGVIGDDGAFTCSVPISQGSNEVQVAASDNADNSSTTSITVNSDVAFAFSVLDSNTPSAGISDDNPGPITFDVEFGVPASYVNGSTLRIDWTVTFAPQIQTQTQPFVLTPASITVQSPYSYADPNNEVILVHGSAVFDGKRNGVYLPSDRYSPAISASLIRVSQPETTLATTQEDMRMVAVLIGLGTVSQREQAGGSTITSSALRQQFGLGNDYSFENESTRADDLGYTHVRTHGNYKGYRVLDSYVISHIDDLQSGITDYTNRLITGLTITPTFTMTPTQATQVVTADAGVAPGSQEPIIYKLDDGTQAVAYYSRTENTYGLLEGYDYLVSGTSSTILDKTTNLGSASGDSYLVGSVSFATNFENSIYKMHDVARKSYIYDLKGSDNFNQATLYDDVCSGCSNDDNWGDGNILTSSTYSTNGQTYGVDAAYGIMMAWDFYQNRLGFSGLDGNGQVGIKAYVHHSTEQRASWTPTRGAIVFGDGNPPIMCLDVIAHEYTHGVIDQGKTGRKTCETLAIIEGLADVFGNETENYANGTNNPPDGDPSDWKFAEECAADRARYINKPSLDGNKSPDWFDDLIGTRDTHADGGVMRHFFWYLANHVPKCSYPGQDNQVCNGNSSLHLPSGSLGIGRHNAQKVLLDAIEDMLWPTTYRDFRSTVLKSAARLLTTTQYDRVVSIWTAVHVSANTASGGNTCRNKGGDNNPVPKL